jgi:hypothetical protein
MVTQTNDASQIRRLNDFVRTTGIGGQTVATKGIRSLSGDAQRAIFSRVRSFSDFTKDNDPYGEHDFGTFEFEGTRINWKIDYYDNDLRYHSPNPADSAVTSRVLTIMLAEEY